MENNRVDGYLRKRIEFYDGTNYGTLIERITIIIEYDLLVDMLKTCPKTEDYRLLLSVLKAINKAPHLESQLEAELEYYKEVEPVQPWSEESGWKENKFGFLVFDSQGKCEKLSIWISYPLCLDLVFSYGDEEIIKELEQITKTKSLDKQFRERRGLK